MKTARFRILIQLPLKEQKYPFVSLSAGAIKLLHVAICFISLQGSTSKLWSNQMVTCTKWALEQSVNLEICLCCVSLGLLMKIRLVSVVRGFLWSSKQFVNHSSVLSGWSLLSTACAVSVFTVWQCIPIWLVNDCHVDYTEACTLLGPSCQVGRHLVGGEFPTRPFKKGCDDNKLIIEQCTCGCSMKLWQVINLVIKLCQKMSKTGYL